jgi:hypothetical protein
MAIWHWGHNATTTIPAFLAQNPHQRGFPRAVTPQEADPLTWLDLTSDSVQQRRPTKADRQVGELNQSHRAGDESRWVVRRRTKQSTRQR